MFLVITEELCAQDFKTNRHLTGQLFQYESEYPGAKVYFKNANQKVESDFDGYFKLSIPPGSQKNDLIINQLGLILEILNIEFDSAKMDLGKIELPAFKSIGIDEFEKLTEFEKENCHPMYCWADLLGYQYTNQLEHEYLTLNCEEQITKFQFNPTTKTITVDWNVIKNCR